MGFLGDVSPNCLQLFKDSGNDVSFIHSKVFKYSSFVRLPSSSGSLLIHYSLL